MSEENKIAVWERPKYEGTDIVPTAETVTALANPQHLVGRENIEVEDLIVPTIALLQGQSDAVTSGVPGAEPGKFQQSNSGEIYEPPLKVLVVHHHKSNAFFPQDQHDAIYPEYKGKESCLSRDGKVGTKHGLCEECRICLDFMDDDRKPPGSHSQVLTVLIPDGPAVIRFGRTSAKPARKFVSNWNFSSKNLWSHPVHIVVHAETKELPGGKKSTYFWMAPKWVKEEETPQVWQDACLEMYNRIKGAHEEGKFSDELEGTSEVGEFD